MVRRRGKKHLVLSYMVKYLHANGGTTLENLASAVIEKYSLYSSRDSVAGLLRFPLFIKQGDKYYLRDGCQASQYNYCKAPPRGKAPRGNDEQDMIKFYNFTLTGPDIVIDYRSKEWCTWPYPDHPRGCPNYNHKKQCPPHAGRFEDLWDVDASFYLVVAEFNVGAHANKLREKHPDWSERKLRCCLYWQNHVRACLTREIDTLLWKIRKQNFRPGLDYTLIPEAQGVHVIATARRVGIKIKIRPDNTIYKIALVGWRKKYNGQCTVGVKP